MNIAPEFSAISVLSMSKKAATRGGVRATERPGRFSRCMSNPLSPSPLAHIIQERPTRRGLHESSGLEDVPTHRDVQQQADRDRRREQRGPAIGEEGQW